MKRNLEVRLSFNFSLFSSLKFSNHIFSKPLKYKRELKIKSFYKNQLKGIIVVVKDE
jgi:hypothetical protein